MTVKLHRAGFDHAKELVNKGRVVLDDRDDWSEHQPSAKEENEFIRRHGMRSAILSAESRAGQYKHTDIESAAAHLHGMLEGPAPGNSAYFRKYCTVETTRTIFWSWAPSLTPGA
jgi:hypothetical protein